ncbi:alpha/beta hydrolase [Flammeovirga sp. MY04]|uniref:alpha/beta fold hydrolase n=1 Tax=Flammeovirga sp. MY04 TaxID=1191459 RepID=UPI00080638A5|nr:alpha/beta hydrolase [Flammeovirga sp. MY04]ANQ49722.1 alpha/beta hydrolase [Flammeovirga sp. MY04]
MKLCPHQLVFVIMLLFIEVSFGQGYHPLDEVIHVSNNHETMPVKVHGNMNAKTLLLVVHGGPGSSVDDYRSFNGKTGLQLIEEKTLVAYWQQRGAGDAKGVDDKKYYTIDQYVSDLDHVVDEMHEVFPHKKIVLLGHSWGGMLSSSYLSSPEHRAKISAWIDAAGVTDGTKLLEYAFDDVDAVVKEHLIQEENLDFWKDVAKQKTPQNSSLLAYYILDKMPDAHRYVNIEKMHWSERAIASNNSLIPEVLLTNNNQNMEELDFPILLIWGKYDYCVSKKLREDLIEHLDAEQITSVELPHSGHYMMMNEPELFSKKVGEFLDKI